MTLVIKRHAGFLRITFMCDINECSSDKTFNLVLVKGSKRSRLLKKAVCISVMGATAVANHSILSPKMQKIFGTFYGRLSFQRSPTR